MLCVVKTSCFVEFFCENKDLNLKLENSIAEITSLKSMLEAHIMMSLLIFCLTFLLVPYLIFLMYPIITHMVLVHERVVLCLDALVSTHALIMVFVPLVGKGFPLKVHILTLS
jgi:hypothetical protein